MPYFPLFINLAEKRCVVVGGGEVGARKIQALLDFGAAVMVLEPLPSEKIRRLFPQITLLERTYAGPADLADAALVIAATDQKELNRQVAEDAKRLGIPVNVVDDPALCTFFFPALVRRGELVAGISSSGICPRLTARLREHLEKVWPSSLGASLEQLGTERLHLMESADSEKKIQELDRLISELGIDFADKTESSKTRDILNND